MSATATKIELPPLDIQTMRLTLIGDSPLIVHAWSHKAREQMLAKQMGKAQQKREKKDPKRDYQDSLYPKLAGKHTFPTVGFKSAVVSACRFAEGVKMTELRGAIHVVGDYAILEGAPRQREDMVRVFGGTADIRFRAEFQKWRATLTIQFNARVITPEQVANLFNIAGFSIGIGEWRPERDGSFGRFHVASSKEART